MIIMLALSIGSWHRHNNHVLSISVFIQYSNPYFLSLKGLYITHPKKLSDVIKIRVTKIKRRLDLIVSYGVHETRSFTMAKNMWEAVGIFVRPLKE